LLEELASDHLFLLALVLEVKIHATLGVGAEDRDLECISPGWVISE